MNILNVLVGMIDSNEIFICSADTKHRSLARPLHVSFARRLSKCECEFHDGTMLARIEGAYFSNNNHQVGIKIKREIAK